MAGMACMPNMTALDAVPAFLNVAVVVMDVAVVVMDMATTFLSVELIGLTMLTVHIVPAMDIVLPVLIMVAMHVVAAMLIHLAMILAAFLAMMTFVPLLHSVTLAGLLMIVFMLPGGGNRHHQGHNYDR